MGWRMFTLILWSLRSIYFHDDVLFLVLKWRFGPLKFILVGCSLLKEPFTVWGGALCVF